MTLARIAEITGGRLSPEADPDAHVTGFVEFDSRKIGPGGLFVAFPGARVTGTTSWARPPRPAPPRR